MWHTYKNLFQQLVKWHFEALGWQPAKGLFLILTSNEIYLWCHATGLSTRWLDEYMRVSVCVHMFIHVCGGVCMCEGGNWLLEPSWGGVRTRSAIAPAPTFFCSDAPIHSHIACLTLNTAGLCYYYCVACRSVWWLKFPFFKYKKAQGCELDFFTFTEHCDWQRCWRANQRESTYSILEQQAILRFWQHFINPFAVNNKARMKKI